MRPAIAPLPRRARAALCGALLGLAAAAAPAQSIRASVDRTRLAVGEQVLLSVTVSGAAGARPVLPDLAPFEVFASGEQKQWSFVDGRTSSSVTYNYALLATQPGHFVVAPVTVEVDGETRASAPFTLEVVAGEAAPEDERQLFLTATVSTEAPFVGQQVLFTWRFYRRVRAAEPRLDPIEFNGFLIEDLGEVREFQTVVGGQQYLVSELRKALFPQEAGELTIPGTRLTCRVVVDGRRGGGGLVDDFFGRRATRPQVLTTPALTLTVRPLPAPPREFSGLVGDFDVAASISQREARVGESMTLELTVSGRGNVQSIPPPLLPELDGFKVYDDKPEASIERRSDGLVGSRTFRKALVPRRPGAIELEPARLVFFDPEAERYVTRRTSPLELSIRPAESDEELALTEAVAPGAGKVSVRILADDILPPYRGLDALARPGPPGGLLPTLLLVPPGLFAVAWAAVRRRRRFAADPALRRRRRAYGRARRALARLRQVDDPPALAEEASRCLRCYVGDKLDLEGSALTPAEAAAALGRLGLDETLPAEVEGLLERLDTARFGAAPPQAGDVGREVEELLGRLEAKLR